MHKVVIPAYQPVVDITTGGISHFEALARANEVGNGGHEKLIATGEEYGFVDLIDMAVLRHVFAVLRDAPGVRIAVNVSVVTIERSCNEILALIYEHMDLACRVIFEITETVEIHDATQVLRFAAAVRVLEAKVAIDDFGAGHFTVGWVTMLQPEYLKLACGMVADLVHTGEQIDVLHELIHRYGGEIIAEHVDSAEKVIELHKLGVKFAQGFYFGAPMDKRAAFNARLEADIASKAMTHLAWIEQKSA